MPEATWKPHEKHGRLTTQSDLPDSVYAFPKQRKEPLTDAQHVRNAGARCDQVTDAFAADRGRIKIALHLDPSPTRQHYGQPATRLVLPQVGS